MVILDNLLNWGITSDTDRFERKKIRVLNSLSLVCLLSQPLYISVFIAQNRLSMSGFNILLSALAVTILFANYKQWVEAGRLLYGCIPLILLGFTYMFGNIGAEYIQIIIIASSLFFWTTPVAIFVSLFALGCFAIAKVMIANLSFPELLWARPIFYYLNLAFSISYVFLFIYIYKQESEYQSNIIDQANRELIQKNKKLEQLYSLALDANPMTGLPGNNSVREAITKAIDSGEPCCVIYADLDNFKGFNDKYGFARGDKAILFTATTLKNSISASRFQDAFIGHIGGDDFVLIVPSDLSQKIVHTIIQEFDHKVIQFYDEHDAANGFISSVNRKGSPENFPIMSISMAGVDLAQGKYSGYFKVNDACAELKKKAKSEPGSCFHIDKRK